jgi:hypothetical protein
VFAHCVADALRYGESKLGLYELLGRTGQRFWQDESYDHWVRGPEELEKTVLYIEENPVAAGLVERVEDWRWSSAFGTRE